MNDPENDHKQLSRLLKAGLPEEASRYLVAFSGGLDSTVLLHCLKQQLPAGSELLALHINHGMQAQADSWAEHCADFCSQHGIVFKAIRVTVDGLVEHGPEAAARNARYKALAAQMQPGDCLLLAQHQQDQAETLMLQLMRGAGVAGLAAMPAVKDFHGGQLVRPWLDVSRGELHAYAKAQALDWIDDPSNEDQAMDRNFLRNRIMPLLAQRWPALNQQIARSAAHAGEASELLDELAVIDLRAVHAGMGLSIAALLGLTPARRRNLLRYWLRSGGTSAPSTAVLASIEQDMLGAGEDAEPHIALAKVELRRYRDLLFQLKPLPEPPGDRRIEWDMQQTLNLPPGCGRLLAVNDDNATAVLPAGQYQVGFMRGGERIRPAGSAHHRRLKHLLQESGVPPWVRRRMPLIYHGQQLVAVADRWISADMPIDAVRGMCSLQWLDAPPGWIGQD